MHNDQNKMRVISWNVNGVRAVAKKNINGEPLTVGENDCILELNSKYNPDVLCLQEIKTDSPADLEKYRAAFPHITVSSAEKKGYSGVAVLSKDAPIKTMIGFYHVQMRGAADSSYSKEGRLITAEFDKYVVVGTYVPNSKSDLSRLTERGAWERDIKAHLNLTRVKSKKPVIYCGDLNVAHQEIDNCNPKSNKGCSGFTVEERGWFSELLAVGFTDTYRVLWPTTIKYSWWSPITKARGRNKGWRIDYVLVSSEGAGTLVAADILNDVYGSDHCPVMADFK